MAKAAATTEKEAVPRITYVPQHDGDPYETVWNRHRFKANVPTEIRDVRNGLSAAEMLKLAKTNRWFTVEGAPKEKKSEVLPSTPEHYRAFAANWIRAAESSSALVKRWDSEKELREDCGCGPDDEEFISTLFNPKKAELLKAEKLAASSVDNG